MCAVAQMLMAERSHRLSSTGAIPHHWGHVLIRAAGAHLVGAVVITVSLREYRCRELSRHTPDTCQFHSERGAEMCIVAYLVGAAGAQPASKEQRGLHQGDIVVLHQEDPQPIAQHRLRMHSAYMYMPTSMFTLSCASGPEQRDVDVSAIDTM